MARLTSNVPSQYWKDPRSWNDGMTAFFGVHLVLTVVSLTLGTIIGVPDECQAAIRGLLPRCDSDTSTGLARDQRMQRTLDRIVTGHGQVGS